MYGAHPLRRNRLGRIDFLDHEAGLVLVKMLAKQPRRTVVRPDERLPTGCVVQLRRVRHVVTDQAERRAIRKNVEGEFISDAPIGHGYPRAKAQASSANNPQ